ncbi:hypothetical protein IKE96_04020 [bacterium]|nr:hypothetical protein [bacterium]MBR2858323.1 hypothetical protein [bacterium]
MAQLFSVYRVVCNGFGYEISCLQTIPLLGMGNDVVFSVNYNDKSSYFSIINPKFLEANNKSILDSRTIQDVIKLPFKVNSIPNHTNLDQAYKVYDQDTGEYQL